METIDSLVEQDKSVLASHPDAGFSSSTTFSNTFKKATGISPHELKRNICKCKGT